MQSIFRGAGGGSPLSRARMRRHPGTRLHRDVSSVARILRVDRADERDLPRCMRADEPTTLPPRYPRPHRPAAGRPIREDRSIWQRPGFARRSSSHRWARSCSSPRTPEPRTAPDFRSLRRPPEPNRRPPNPAPRLFNRDRPLFNPPPAPRLLPHHPAPPKPSDQAAPERRPQTLLQASFPERASRPASSPDFRSPRARWARRARSSARSKLRPARARNKPRPAWMDPRTPSACAISSSASTS